MYNTSYHDVNFLLKKDAKVYNNFYPVPWSVTGDDDDGDFFKETRSTLRIGVLTSWGVTLSL